MLEEKRIISQRRFSRYYNVLGPFFAQAQIQAYTMLVLSIFSIAFFGFFAIRPTLTTIFSLQRQIKDEQVVALKLQEKINQLSQVRIAYEVLKPNLPILDNALPFQPDFPPFIKNLESLATKSAVVIDSLSFQDVDYSAQEATSSTQAIPITYVLSINGEYTNFVDLVESLSNFERLITIDGLTFSFQKDILQLTLVGKTYYTN